MHKAMLVVTMLLVFALLASAEQFETVELEVVKGGSVGHTYFGHPEARTMGLYPYSAEYVTAWEMVNPSQDIDRLQPGIYKFPVGKVEEVTTQTETKEITDATDGGNRNDGNRTDTTALAAGGRIDPREAGIEPYSLDALLATSEEGQSPEQPAATQSPNVESREAESLIAALEEENITLKSEVERYSKMIQNGEWIEARVLKTQEAKVHGLIDENERLELKLADKSKAEALALGNNGSSNTSFIPIILICAGYVIGLAGIIILVYLLRRSKLRVSQLEESDRLRQEDDLRQIREQIKQEFAQTIKDKSERVTALERTLCKIRRRHEAFEYSLICPGVKKKATGQDMGGEIFFPIENRTDGGIPLIRIPGIEELERAEPANIIRKLLTEEHQNHPDAYFLPSSYHTKRLTKSRGNRTNVKPAKLHNFLDEEAPARVVAQ